MEAIMRTKEHISPASRPSSPRCEMDKTATTRESCWGSTVTGESWVPWDSEKQGEGNAH